MTSPHRPGPADVEVTELADLDAIRAAAAVLDAVWGAEDVMSAHITRAVQHAGGYVAGAWSRADPGRLVAASVAFGGLEHGPDGHRPTLHSHITGVLPGWRGVGMALKDHQRAWCLARGIEAVTWTFDPLVARNAWFNLAKLGASVIGYAVDLYGPMTDGLNAGQPSDRLDVRWDLHRAVPGPVAAEEARWLLADVDGGPVPGPAPSAGERLLVAVPEDVEALRRTDPALAGRWRMAVRDTLGAALADGWRVVGMADPHTYVLAG